MSTNSEAVSNLKRQKGLQPVSWGPSILVVDDDPDFLELIAGSVARIPDASVVLASSCEEAVDNLTHQSFDLVICDWALATRTGPEVFCLADPLLVQIRQVNEKIPVIFMSGSEKVASTQSLRSFKYFAPVTFIIKNLGPHMIGVMAENVLQYFDPVHLEKKNAYLS